MKILIIHCGKQIRRFRQGNCFGKERFQDFDTEKFLEGLVFLVKKLCNRKRIIFDINHCFLLSNEDFEKDILQNDIQRIKNVCITVYFLSLVGFKPKIKLFHGIFSFLFLSSNPALKISLNYIFSDGVFEVLLCVYFYLNIF
jgi:hypothetical protein